MSDIGERNCCTAGRPYAAPVKAESRSVLLPYAAPPPAIMCSGPAVKCRSVESRFIWAISHDDKRRLLPRREHHDAYLDVPCTPLFCRRRNGFYRHICGGGQSISTPCASAP